MQTQTVLGLPFHVGAGLPVPHPPPAAPRPYFAPVRRPLVRIANRASTRPIIHTPGAYRPDFYGRDRQYAREAEEAADRARMYAMQTAWQQQSAMMPPTPLPVQQVQSSPASPGADLTPQQDTTAAADAASADGGHPHNKHLLLFVGIAAVAGVGGYMLIKHKKG